MREEEEEGGREGERREGERTPNREQDAGSANMNAWHMAELYTVRFLL